MPVDISAGLCPIASLGAGDNPTPLPGDPLLRSWGSLLVSSNDNTCRLDIAMDRDETGTSGPTVEGGWFVNNPPDLGSPGQQFLAPEGGQQTTTP
jgi:hypothetical protein